MKQNAAKAMSSINWKKRYVQSNIRVKDNEEETSSGSAGTKSVDQKHDTSTDIRKIKKEVSSYGLYVNDHDVPEVQDSTGSFVGRPQSSYRSYNSASGSRGHLDTKSCQAWEPTTEPQHKDVSFSGYSSSYDSNMTNATSESFKHLYPRKEAHYIGKSSTESSATGVSASYRRGPANLYERKVNREEMDDSYTSENSSMEQTRRTILDRRTRSRVISTGTGAHLGTNYDPRSCESETVRSVRSASTRAKQSSESFASCKTIVHLKPLGIGFAIENTGHITLDGETLGKTLDEWCPHFERLSIDGFEYSLNVFKFQERYYSEEISKLWQLQTLERYINNVKISGSVIQIPTNIFLDQLVDSLKPAGILSGERWRSLDTLKMLTTKRKRNLSLSDIYYTTNTIQDTLNGRSIIKTLVEIFSGGIRDHELSVMEFENKYYTLENEKLWVLKHAEKVLGKLSVTGNVKISMDYIMFHSFTTKGVENVKINWSIDVHVHTDKERFMLAYIQRRDKESQ